MSLAVAGTLPMNCESVCPQVAATLGGSQRPFMKFCVSFAGLKPAVNRSVKSQSCLHIEK